MSEKEFYEKLRADSETKKIRDIKLELTDMQYSKLQELVSEIDFLDISELIVSFVGDLTECHSNGSDERRLTNEWFERAFYMYKDY
jgi:hypothetical protein